MRIVIIVEGGVVQNVLADGKLRVVVVDYNTDGVEQGELTNFFGEAVMYEFDAESAEEVKEVGDRLEEAYRLVEEG